MSDVPVQLVVAAFQDENSAKLALKELKQAQRERLIKIDDAAVIRKDEKGKLHIKETGDWGGGKGAAVGGAIGAAVGIILGPGAILTGAAGALIGGLTAKLRDSGFDDNRLKKLGEGLEPGTSAIVAIVEHKWVQQVQDEIDEYATDVFTEAISADIAEQLQAGNEIELSAISGPEGIEISRIAGNEEQVEASRVLATDEGVVAERMVATEEGVVAEQVTITDEGVSDVVVAATDEGVVAAGVIATDEGVVAARMIATPEEEEAEGEVTEETEEAEQDTQE